jgi:hypothetical protein
MNSIKGLPRAVRRPVQFNRTVANGRRVKLEPLAEGIVHEPHIE